MNKIIISLFISALFLVSLNLKGQSGANAAGGDAASNNVAISYSIGNCFYKAATQSGYYVSAGLQHPSITVTTGLESRPGKEPDLRAFPNPTNEKLHLTINDPEESGFSFILVDQNGKILKTENITNVETEIPLEQFAPGSYILKIYHKKEEVKTFIILKY